MDDNNQSQVPDGFIPAPGMQFPAPMGTVMSRSGLWQMPVINQEQCGSCDPSFRDNILAAAGGLYSTVFLPITVTPETVGPASQSGSYLCQVPSNGIIRAFVNGVDQTPGAYVAGQNDSEGLPEKLSYAYTNITSEGFPASDEALTAYGMLVSILSPLAEVREAYAGLTVNSGAPTLADLASLGPDNGFYRSRLATQAMDAFSIEFLFNPATTKNFMYLGALSEWPTDVSRGDGQDNGFGMTNQWHGFRAPVTFVQPVNNRRASDSPAVNLRSNFSQMAGLLDGSGNLVTELEQIQGAASSSNALNFLLPVRIYLCGRLYCSSEVCDDTDPATKRRIAKMEKELAELKKAR